MRKLLLPLMVLCVLFAACTKEVEVPVTNPVNTQLQAQVAELTATISSIQSNLNTTQSALNSLTGEHAQLQAQYDTTVADLEEALGQITDLTVQIESGAADNQALTLQIEELTLLVAELQAQVDTVESAIQAQPGHGPICVGTILDRINRDGVYYFYLSNTDSLTEVTQEQYNSRAIGDCWVYQT